MKQSLETLKSFNELVFLVLTSLHFRLLEETVSNDMKDKSFSIRLDKMLAINVFIIFLVHTVFTIDYIVCFTFTRSYELKKRIECDPIL